MKRRDLLRSLALFTTLGATGTLSKASAQVLQDAVPENKRVLRIAHLTDMHISDDAAAIKGLEKCFLYLQNMQDPPQLILNGGDTINDGLYKTRSEVRDQWGVWHDVRRNNNSLPIHYCLGNHDIWGLYNPGKDAMTGKRVALDLMEVDRQYRSFDHAGWHFIILDSTQKKKNGLWYTARLDEEQLEWLKNDLAAVPAHQPVLVLSHIPILCANVFMDDIRIRFGKFQLPGSWMHTDVQDIVHLFAQYPNVKVCLSGHIHMADAVRYNGVSYYCNGAVSGDWWKSTQYKGTKAGFAIIDLYANGDHQHQYISYNNHS